MRYFLILILSALLFSCKNASHENPHVLIETGMGDIELELYPSKAPKTVAAFVANIKAGIYDKGSFYWVLKADELPSDFNTGIIQGGTWDLSAGEKPGAAIPHESTKQSGLSHTDGTISMARTDTGTARTEFFICVGDQTMLDFGNNGTKDGQGFAAFGKVLKGMPIVKKIHNQPSTGDRFNQVIRINRISVE